MLLGHTESPERHLCAPEPDQSERSQLLREAQRPLLLALETRQQLLGLLGLHTNIGSLVGQRQSHDIQHDLQLRAPALGYSLQPLGRNRDLPLHLLKRAVPQPVGRK